jgi:hypothetical protein
LPHGTVCPYCALFVPLPPGEHANLHGLRDAPRPYVVRPPLDGRAWYRAGERLTFGLVLFGWAGDYALPILTVLRQQGGLDLSQGRGRAALAEVARVAPLSDATQALFSPNGLPRSSAPPTRTVGEHLPIPEQADRNDPSAQHPLSTSGEHIVAYAQCLSSTLRLRFLTPTRIKYDHQQLRTPTGPALVVNALRRISTLCACYGTALWEPAADPAQRASLLALADQVRVRQVQTRWVDQDRTSGATGQRMPLGGFTGSATLENVPLPLRVILVAGSLVHVGDDTVFGNGLYTVQDAADGPQEL